MPEKSPLQALLSNPHQDEHEEKKKQGEEAPPPSTSGSGLTGSALVKALETPKFGFDRYLAERQAAAGGREISGKRRKAGALYTNGPYKGMTQAQMMEDARAEYAGMSDVDRQAYETAATGGDVMSDREMAAMDNHRQGVATAYGLAQHPSSGGRSGHPPVGRQAASDVEGGQSGMESRLRNMLVKPRPPGFREEGKADPIGDMIAAVESGKIPNLYSPPSGAIWGEIKNQGNAKQTQPLPDAPKGSGLDYLRPREVQAARTAAGQANMKGNWDLVKSQQNGPVQTVNPLPGTQMETGPAGSEIATIEIPKKYGGGFGTGVKRQPKSALASALANVQ